MFEQELMPLMSIMLLEVEYWLQGARFWAESVSRGRQLSDVDLLLAALVFRRGAVLVSNDADFDNLPVHRVDWRAP